MRIVQIVLFFIGLAAFLAAAGFIGDDTGDALWRTGVAAMVTDLVVMGLWPARKPA